MSLSRPETFFTSDTKISGREKFLTTPINFGTLNFYVAALDFFLPAWLPGTETFLSTKNFLNTSAAAQEKFYWRVKTPTAKGRAY